MLVMATVTTSPFLTSNAVGVIVDRTATIFTSTLFPFRVTPASLTSQTAIGWRFSSLGYTSIGFSLSALMICA